MTTFLLVFIYVVLVYIGVVLVYIGSEVRAIRILIESQKK